MTPDEPTPDEQTAGQQGSPDRDTPGREAEEVSRSGSEEVPGSGSESQEELRARLEDQIRKLKIEDLLVESTVSVLNLTARRIAKEDERDLEQGRIGIEAVRAWVELLPEEAAGQIRNALSELQVLYAQAAEGKPLSGSQATGEGGEGRPGQAETPAAPSGDTATGPKPQTPPGEPPPRLWTPGSG